MYDAVFFVFVIIASFLAIKVFYLLYWSEESVSAIKTAVAIRRKLRISDDADDFVAVVLGSGWDKALLSQLQDLRSIPLNKLPGFRNLPAHPTHKRLLHYGRLGQRWVLVLQGRVHMNEALYSIKLVNMVRLQIEMLQVLGAKRIVLTAAVGGLLRGKTPEKRRAQIGSICIVDSFVTVYAPDMPLYGGEFVNPEDTLNPGLRQIGLKVSHDVGLDAFEGGHLMVRGPFFEGRKHDKLIMARSGADVVGMSILPEACVAALCDTQVLALGFVSNDDVEAHSDELVRERVQAASAKLDALLVGVVSRL